MTKLLSKIFIGIMFISALAPITSVYANADTNQATANDLYTWKKGFKSIDEDSLVRIFSVIEEIPENSYSDPEQNIDLGELVANKEDQELLYRDAWSCSWAIGKVVAQNLPWGKLLKAQRLIKELGGTYTAAKLIIFASTKAERSAALTGAGRALADLILNFSDIKKSCS
ncbi:hypothetical protein LQZ24_02845 [Fructobacillus sp. M1-13]|uniref:Uncharacterized protein n=1 Tax=Fructobacillus papyriferae TaxID=2713171 RepID=A0ABS5QQA5_9LACO|nr:hypothetical protein [Fructobacillus papyriferae]MBS9335363.1 hypothetical protein [Fructobacillus papyriferae]MCD2158969.1 hypothetical protein [Fructobacillus papyriferae]